MGFRTWGGRIAVASRLGPWPTLALVVLGALGLGCMDSRSTEPSTVDPAFAKGGGASDPTVASADPAAAPQDTTLDVHVFGSNYDQGSKVDFTRGGVVDPKLQVNSTTYLSSTELVANVSITVDAAPISYDVMVTKSTGKKGIGTEKFAVLVPLEVLSAPTGVSHVRGVSDNGFITGGIRTTCGPGFAPALWDPAGELTPLPALPGTCGGVASDVNSAGVAVGSAYIGSSFSENVRWVPSGGSYQVEVLPRLPDGSLSGAWAVNEVGWVAASNSSAVWSESTGWQMLQRPNGATTCLGSIGINNLGGSAGECSISGKWRAVYWSSPTAPPVLLPLAAGASAAYVNGINDAGVVVGYTSVTISKNKVVNRATRWVPSGGTWTVEFLSDLGTGSSAWAINDAGQIAGTLSAFPLGPRPAFWDANGSLWQLDGTGEALGLSEPAWGPVVAGRANGGGATWRP
jgi:uncharacterized membrane protein